MSQPTKLTEFQLNRIIKRFVSKSSSLLLLASPFQTDNYIIATNAYISLFLSCSVTSNTITNEHESVSATILKLEEYHMTHSDFDPSTRLSLDGASIQAIIKALRAVQSSQQTKYTKTRIVYSKRTNELILTTIHVKGKFIEMKEDKRFSQYHKTSSVSQHRDENISVVVNTTYLINSLLTQFETNRFTTIEYSDFQSNHIKLVNDVSAIVTARIKGEVELNQHMEIYTTNTK